MSAETATGPRVLVTGGAGFIGSAVCRHLIAKMRWPVVIVDALTYAANLESLSSVCHSPLYSFEHADIRDGAVIAAILQKHRPDAILHLAAESHVDRSITGSAVFLETNIMGTATLLEAARAYFEALPALQRDAFRFLHISTDEVYGSLGSEGLFSEQTPYDPSSPYSASKAASDHLVRAWTRTYGLPCLIANCSNNHGPFQFPEKLVPLTILNALEGKPLPLYGDGSNRRDWLFVEDHVRALVLLLTKGRVGERYNIGASCERTNLEVVEKICGLMDRYAPKRQSHRELITFVSDRPGHDKRYAIDACRMERELGWRALESFDSGFEKTVLWYLANEAWWRPLRQSVYSGNRLGLIGRRA